MSENEVNIRILSIQNATSGAEIFTAKGDVSSSVFELDRNQMSIEVSSSLTCQEKQLVEMELLFKLYTNWIKTEASCKIESRVIEEKRTAIILKIHNVESKFWDPFLEQIEATRKRAQEMFRSVKGA